MLTCDRYEPYSGDSHLQNFACWERRGKNFSSTFSQTVSERPVCIGKANCAESTSCKLKVDNQLATRKRSNEADDIANAEYRSRTRWFEGQRFICVDRLCQEILPAAASGSIAAGKCVHDDECRLNFYANITRSLQQLRWFSIQRRSVLRLYASRAEGLDRRFHRTHLDKEAVDRRTRNISSDMLGTEPHDINIEEWFSLPNWNSVTAS